MTDRLVPGEGRTVPLEDGQPWPIDNDGNAIPQHLAATRYIRRRLRRGDLVVAAEAEVTPEPVKSDAQLPAPSDDTDAETKPKTAGARGRKTEA